MRIVVLDGYTLNPGDLSWEEFVSLGDFEVYERTPAEQVRERGRGAEVLLTNKAVLPRETIEHLTSLRYIGVLATGTNVVDLVAARERRIVVTNVPAYGMDAVAQATMALLLALTNHVALHAEAVRQGAWTRNADWCFWLSPLTELSGKTFGIIGYGRIGKAVGKLAEAFGMRLLVHSRAKESGGQEAGRANLEQVFRESDVLSLHCPLTPETKNLINAGTLRWMKPGALLLNTSRGGLVDEAALAAALNTGKIAGAGLDVLSQEPPAANNPLLIAKNCLITPHQAWATREARGRLMRMAAENLKAWMAGRPINVVNAG